MSEISYDVIVIGGGAAGFFAAVNLAQFKPDYRIAILERGNEALSKVRVSGGGRCNLTHACFDPRQLCTYYPRGNKALRGPFHSFACQDTIEWFAERGVETHTEADGRMFPVTNDSQTIINCLMGEAKLAGIDILYGEAMDALQPPNEESEKFVIETRSQKTFTCDKVMLSTGSNNRIWNMLGDLGHTIISAVPSLFTFNINDEPINGLSGLSVPQAQVKISGTKLVLSGPLLITHWGMSGPAILKMSAFAARELSDMDYRFEISVNWTGRSEDQLRTDLTQLSKNHLKKAVINRGIEGIPSRLWKILCENAGIPADLRYADLSKSNVNKLIAQLSQSRFKVDGKSTFKEEFVTAGGVKLSEINFKRFESKKIPGLFMAGEILDIDAVTGGFNFQAAWTGGYLAAQAMGTDSES